jgi:hypothetical protein
MDQAEGFADRTMSLRVTGGFPKLASTSPFWTAAIAAVLATPLLLPVTADVVEQSPKKQLRNAAPPPTGHWRCVLDSTILGTLVVDGWQYSLSIDGEPTTSGTLEPVGGQAMKNKAAYVRVESGPLKDRFGAGLGFHDDAAEPPNLLFSIRSGLGLHCVHTL